MRSLNHLAIPAASLLLLLGCADSVRVGAFGGDAFYTARDHYRVLYTDPPNVVNDGWVLENFRLFEGRVLEAKWTGDFVRHLSVDEDDDGVADRRATAEAFDLRLTHRADGSTIWAQTHPIAARQSQRSLQVVARDFVDRVGGGSYLEVDWAADAVRSRRVGTRIVEEGPVTVDGVAGYRVTFDIVSLDQREASPQHQGERVTAVIVRPSHRWHANVQRPEGRGLPMLVLFGYASRAELHPARSAEFDDFLRRVDFRERD